MISLDDFSDLLGVLYSAPFHPERWAQFLDLLCKHTGSRSSFLLCADARQNLSVAAHGGVQHDPQALASYATEFAGRDPFLLPVVKSGKTGVLDCNQLLPREELEKSDVYRYLHAPNGLMHPGMVTLTCTLRRLEVISLWRSAEQGDLDADSLRLLEMLVPHLHSAMEMRQALGTAEARASGAEGMADASATATFLLSPSGEIVHLNNAARELIQEGDGLWLKEGRLIAANPLMRKRLKAFLLRNRAGQGRSAGTYASFQAARPLSLERPSGKRPLQLLASPILAGDGGLVLLVTDPEKPVVFRDDVLREHYGFTESETEVANGLLTGYALEEIAALRNVKLATVRSQIKSILLKTRTARQADAVRLLLTLPASK